jgi:DNA repair exonuclease SbcCD ATPase subunit
MLIFKKISWKNFLSTGAVQNSIDLNKHSSTLITGKNGEGKSTILCALTFSLFGRPFRNISKGQLVNSINKKNCVVEIEFSVNGHEYRVVRGIKPNIFEIHCDGQLINQDAALKDYQKVLEQQILKLNYKTFTQVVILGSATFVPFMQLKANERREVIEDILDIKIFSVMNSLLKDKAVDTKAEITAIESTIASQKVKIEAQKKLIAALVSSKQDVVDNLEQKIKANDEVIENTAVQVSELSSKIEDLTAKHSKYTEVPEAIKKANSMRTKIKTKVESCEHDIQFFHTNETCPSCAQHIEEDHKLRLINGFNEKIEQDNAKLAQLETALEKMQKQWEDANTLMDEIRTFNIDMSTLNNTISVLTKQNRDLRSEINSTEGDTGNITEEKTKLRDLADSAISQVEAKSALLEHRNLQEVASLLLKDTGIKTAIIREYLPVMNKLINKYLTAMDFYVKFELDESFNELIKSRNRDAFTYDSFSEGEKRRLDLAILFTWRQIAKMKNSVNTNIMILDEILDGALDGAGIDFFLSIMNQFGEQTSVFVISHKVDQMIERFDHVIRVEKKNDFSLITQ